MKDIKFLNNPLKKLLLLMVCYTNVVFVSAQMAVPQAGYQNFRIGAVKVVALSDGTIPVNALELLHAEDPEQVPSLLKKAYLNDPVEVSINAYLIKLDNRFILLDTGSGELFGPSYGGKLVESLWAAGYHPNDITDILITHVHLDHSGGLTVKDRMVFPNATVHVNKKEIDFWLNKIHPQENDTDGVKTNRVAFLALKRYLDAGRVNTFEGNVNLFPGLIAKEYVGHTPGHSVFVLESEEEKLVFWGDLIHVAAVQLHGPEVANGYDFDKQRAATQRQKAYEEAANEGYLVAADHISFPGIGRIRRDRNGLNWIPVPYSLTGRTR